MSDDYEYADLTFEELTAVVGKELPPGVYVSIGVPFLVTEEHDFAVCVRLKPTQPVQESMRSLQPDEPMRDDGGSWRDAERTGG